MDANRTPGSYQNCQIGWICAIDIEIQAAKAALDKIDLANVRGPKGDNNEYILGEIGEHQVILTQLPRGKYGTTSAANVAAHMKRSFPKLVHFLMVGIGGGAPRYAYYDQEDRDIRLGDVVVSEPTTTRSGVVQYDFGKRMHGSKWPELSGRLQDPSASLQKAVESLKVKHDLESEMLVCALHGMAERMGNSSSAFSYQGSANDKLFLPSCIHQHSGDDCVSCDKNLIVKRPKRNVQGPVVHYGTIGSGNQVIKDSMTRDMLRDEANILCFEMEAAGLMDELKCLVIRGICDYADSHKNDRWQPYAAATAAAYARELVHEILLQAPTSDDLMLLEPGNYQFLHFYTDVNPEEERIRLLKEKEPLQVAICTRILEEPSLRSWKSENNEGGLYWIHGNPGTGKTMFAANVVSRLSQSLSGGGTKSLFAYFFCQRSDSRLNNAVSIVKALIYGLAAKDQTLLFRLRDQHMQMFPEASSDVTLSSLWMILLDLFECASVHIFLVIDAINECIFELPELLAILKNFILSGSEKVSWMITSRNNMLIRKTFKLLTKDHELDLHSKDDFLTELTNAYIDARVLEIAALEQYSDEFADRWRHRLRDKANGTFLWVAPVLAELQTSLAMAATDVPINDLPRNLVNLYGFLLQQVHDQCKPQDIAFCETILRVLAIAYEPLNLTFLRRLWLLDHGEIDQAEIERLVDNCGSLLHIRHSTVMFVHPSVVRYINVYPLNWKFPRPLEHDHRRLGLLSLHLMTSLPLQVVPLRNSFNAFWPLNSTYPEYYELSKNPSHVLPAHIQYICKYWALHVERSASIHEYTVQQCITDFFDTSLLSWIHVLELLSEQLSIIENLSSIWRITQDDTKRLGSFSYDAFRLVARVGNDVPPSLVFLSYGVALAMAPPTSPVRAAYNHEIPGWLQVITGLEQDWGTRVRSIKVFIGAVGSLTFAPNNKLVACAPKYCYKRSNPGVHILNALAGTLYRLLESDDVVDMLTFSPNGKKLAGIVQSSHTILIWDLARTDASPAKRLLDRDYPSTIVAFSPDSMYLVRGSDYGTLTLWNTNTWQEQRLDSKHESRVLFITFLTNTVLKTGCERNMHCIIDIITGQCEVVRLTNDDYNAKAEVISPDHEYSVRLDFVGLKFVHLSNNHERQFLGFPYNHGTSLAIAPDGSQLAWGSSSGANVMGLDLTGHNLELWTHGFDKTEVVAYSNDSSFLVSGTSDGHVHIWDVRTKSDRQQRASPGYSKVLHLACAPNGKLIAFDFQTSSVKLVDTTTGQELAILQGSFYENLGFVKFSADSTRLAFGSCREVCIWDVSLMPPKLLASQPCMSYRKSGAFSVDSSLFAYKSHTDVLVLDLRTGSITFSTDSGLRDTRALYFTPRDNHLVFEVMSNDKRFLLFLDLENQQILFTIPASYVITMVSSPSGDLMATAYESGTYVDVWNLINQQLQVRIDGAASAHIEFFSESVIFCRSHETGSVYKLEPNPGHLGDHKSPMIARDLAYGQDQYNHGREVLTCITFQDGMLKVGFKKAIPLPHDFQPYCLDSVGSLVIILNEDGKLLILKIDLDQVVALLYPNYVLRSQWPDGFSPTALEEHRARQKINAKVTNRRLHQQEDRFPNW